MTPEAQRDADCLLIGRFLERRDEETFRALYRAHTAALYALALRLTGGDVREAEDLVQEAWSRAVRALASFRAESALRSWLSGFLINARRERMRAERRERTTPLDEAEAREPARDLLLDLEQAIASLPDGARQVFVLHDVEGYTHDEIATMLDVVPGTSKSQLSRARSLLRAVLDAPSSEASA